MTQMDRKARSLISRLCDAIGAGSFAEREVFCLLMLLREHASYGSPVRELGDFMAHRERSKGPVHDYLQKNGRILVAGNFEQLDNGPLYSADEITASINDLLFARVADAASGKR